MKKICFILSTLLLSACSQGSQPDQAASRPATETSASASATIVSERYDVSYGDKTLYGMITAPDNYKETQLPAVVLSHGFNNTLEQFEDYAQFMASQGYVVYRFDFYGGSTSSKSGGTDMLDMSVTTELEDLTQVVTSLTSEGYIGDTVSLLGASQGGVVSTLYAANHPDKVDKLMLIFPAFVLFDDIKETLASYGDSLPAVITHKNAQLGSRYLTDANAIDYQAEQRKVSAPTLIIQGTADTVVPYQYAVEASQTIPNAQLVTVEGGGHWVTADFNAVAQPAIEAFLKE